MATITKRKHKQMDFGNGKKKNSEKKITTDVPFVHTRVSVVVGDPLE